MLIGRFQGTPKGTLGADGPLGENIVLAGTQMRVYFQSPEGQKGNSGQGLLEPPEPPKKHPVGFRVTDDDKH